MDLSTESDPVRIVGFNRVVNLSQPVVGSNQNLGSVGLDF